MAMSVKQVNIIAQARYEGKTQLEACQLAGIGINNPDKLCKSPKVLARIAYLEAQEERIQKERDNISGAKDPMTLKEYQAFLERKMLDSDNKDAARYAEMYGKTIRAFVDKVEVESNVSYADILAKRKNKNK